MSYLTHKLYRETKNRGGFVSGDLTPDETRWLEKKGFIKFEFQHPFAIRQGLTGWKIYSVTDAGREWMGKDVPRYLNSEQRAKIEAQSAMNEYMAMG